MENMPPRLVVPEWFTIRQGKWLETGLFPAIGGAREGLARASPSGLRDHAAGPVVQQRHGGEVYRLGNLAGSVAPVKTR